MPIALFLNYLWQFSQYSRESEIAYIQRWAYLQIKRSLESTGQIPETINPEYSQNYIEYYNPAAWSDPESILFLYQYGRFYTITFGDGKQATLTYWFVPSDPQRNKDIAFSELKRKPSIFANSTRVLVIGAIAIVAATLVSSRFLQVK